MIGELATLDPFARRNATVRTTKPSLVLVYDVRTFRSLAATAQRAGWRDGRVRREHGRSTAAYRTDPSRSLPRR